MYIKIYRKCKDFGKSDLITIIQILLHLFYSGILHYRQYSVSSKIPLQNNSIRR